MTARDDRPSVVSRFLAIPTTTGRTESVDGGGRVPADEEFTRLAGELAQAAAVDPWPFNLPESLRDSTALTAVLRTAGDRLRADGHAARLDAPQQGALEAIVRLTGRPALLVNRNWVELPSGPWEILAPHRDAISRIVSSVGRLDVAAQYGVPYVGSAFVVGDGLIMTSGHVVAPYALATGSSWELDAGCGLSFDVTQEHGQAAPGGGLRVASIVWMGDRRGVDLALLRLTDPGPADPAWPAPLAIQADPACVVDGGTVYVVGYPAADTERNPVDAVDRIMNGVFGMKRLAPGQVMSVDRARAVLTHDCTTLGGNSGSCVVDLRTNAIVGVHGAGHFGAANQAVYLPALHANASLKTLAWRRGLDE